MFFPPSGKVLDTGSRSKPCKSCDYWSKQDQTSARYKQWKKDHAKECTATHTGSSGSMEAAAAVDIFKRSIENNNLRYTRFIGDGDTNSFSKVSESKPYGESDPPLPQKVECVGHVQKRMGTRLRKLKTSWGSRKMSDGKTIGGAKRLTKKKIDYIQVMYGNAIREHSQDLEGMWKAIWAIFFHTLSTNKDPKHGLCDVSWCKYLQKKAENKEKEYDHHPLPLPIMKEIKPIFTDLTDKTLLRKCLDGLSQNANESFNNLIWSICPKNKYHGLQTVDTAVGLSVVIFNDGMQGLFSVFENLQLDLGSSAKAQFLKMDRLRFKKAETKATQATKDARRARRRAKLGLSDKQDSSAYASGSH